MLGEFKTFISRGNVLDLAVAVIIGAAFGKIVTALTDDILMPVIGQVTGGTDFSSHFALLGPVPASYKGSLTDYAALKEAGVAMLGYGSFITAVINFVIMAFVIFLLIRQATRFMPAKVETTTGPTEVELLSEIRDSLRGGVRN